MNEVTNKGAIQAKTNKYLKERADNDCKGELPERIFANGICNFYLSQPTCCGNRNIYKNQNR